MTIQQRHAKNRYYIWNNHVLSAVEPHYFSPTFWQQKNSIVGSSKGRNTAYFIDYEELQMVLRRYYRGGFVGKIFTDQFFLAPAHKSRAVQEFQLLQWMHEQGLPVPQPYAAFYERSGLFYRASILIERIPCAQDFFSFLLTKEAANMEREQQLTLWFNIGVAIQKLHAAQVYHSDLNCHNILLDNTHKVWLIDFDKCERRVGQTSPWKNENLNRLKRSLEKERSLHPSFDWHDIQWQALIQGYNDYTRSVPHFTPS